MANLWRNVRIHGQRFYPYLMKVGAFFDTIEESLWHRSISAVVRILPFTTMCTTHDG